MVRKMSGLHHAVAKRVTLVPSSERLLCSKEPPASSASSTNLVRSFPNCQSAEGAFTTTMKKEDHCEKQKQWCLENSAMKMRNITVESIPGNHSTVSCYWQSRPHAAWPAPPLEAPRWECGSPLARVPPFFQLVLSQICAEKRREEGGRRKCPLSPRHNRRPRPLRGPLFGFCTR